mgnify:CR=1 FL=1
MQRLERDALERPLQRSVGRALDLHDPAIAAQVARRSADPLFQNGSVRVVGDRLGFVYKAAAEIGEANLRCVTFSGTGYGAAVGQAFESGVNVDWPRIDSLANYTRTINFETRTIKEEFDRKPGLNPASWKYGLGWQGGTPLQKNPHQTFIVNGDVGWHMDGAGATPVPLPLTEETDFAFTADDLRSRLSPKTKMVILNSPGNPTGGYNSKALNAEIDTYTAKKSSAEWIEIFKIGRASCRERV